MTTKYTVLVMRPDYIASDYGQDSYQAWVEAVDVPTAQRAGQRQALRTDLGPDLGAEYEDVYASDYFVLAVYEGHLADLKMSDV